MGTKKTDIFVTAFGRTQLASQWIEENGLNVTTSCIVHRLRKGIDPEEAVSKGRMRIKFKSDPEPLVIPVKKKRAKEWRFVRVDSHSGYFRECEV